MISATGYILSCESEPACAQVLAGANRFRLIDEARAMGWQINVKLNGETAIRGGRDYCPAHRRESRNS